MTPPVLLVIRGDPGQVDAREVVGACRGVLHDGAHGARGGTERPGIGGGRPVERGIATVSLQPVEPVLEPVDLVAVRVGQRVHRKGRQGNEGSQVVGDAAEPTDRVPARHDPRPEHLGIHHCVAPRELARDAREVCPEVAAQGKEVVVLEADGRQADVLQVAAVAAIRLGVTIVNAGGDLGDCSLERRELPRRVPDGPQLVLYERGEAERLNPHVPPPLRRRPGPRARRGPAGTGPP